MVQPLLARLVGLAELKLEVAGGSGSGGVAGVPARGGRGGPARGAARARGRAAASGGRGGARRRRPDEPARARSRRGAVARAVRGRPRARRSTSCRWAGWSSRRCGPAPCRWLLLLVGGRDHAGHRVPGHQRRRSCCSPPLFAGVTFVWSRINQGANFRAAISPDGIRLRHGLTETRAQTVPPGRVQAIRLTAGPAVARPGLVARRDQRRRLRPGRPAAAGHRAAPGRHARRGDDRALARPARPGRRRPGGARSTARPDGAGRRRRVHRRAPQRRAGWTPSAGGGTASGSPSGRW